jgi:hypothetical protein
MLRRTKERAITRVVLMTIRVALKPARPAFWRGDALVWVRR